MVDERTNNSNDGDELIGLSDFVKLYAEELGVGLSAVTNWRNRFADFPEPRGPSRRPQFFVKSELIDWAVRHDKLAPVARQTDPRPLAVAHEMLQDNGIPDEDRTLSLAVAAVALARSTGTLTDSLRRPRSAGRGSEDTQAADDIEAPAVDAYRRLNVSQRRRLADSIHRHGSTPLSLRLEFADATGDHALLDDPLTGRILVAAVHVGRSIHDPCCGSGLLLSLITSTQRRRATTEISAQEIDPALAAAASLLLAAEDVNAQITCADSLSPETPTKRYETVVAVPPKDPPSPATPGNEGSEGDAVSAAEWTGRWVLTVSDRLAPNGSAAVVVPTRWLMAKGGHAAATRRHLLDRGLLEAVVLLPTPTSTSRVGTAVVLVLRGTRPDSKSGILVIDTTAFVPPRRWAEPTAAESHLVDSVRTVLGDWRAQAGPAPLLPVAGHDDVSVELVDEIAAREGYFFDLAEEGSRTTRRGATGRHRALSIPTPRTTIADLVPSRLIVTTGRDPGSELPPGTERAVVLETSGPHFGSVSVLPLDRIPRKGRGIAVFSPTGENPAEDLPLEFLAAWLSSQDNQDHLVALGTSGTRESRSVAHADVLRLSADFPEVGERQRIATLWAELDHHEEDLRRALDQIDSERRALISGAPQ